MSPIKWHKENHGNQSDFGARPNLTVKLNKIVKKLKINSTWFLKEKKLWIQIPERSKCVVMKGLSHLVKTIKRSNPHLYLIRFWKKWIKKLIIFQNLLIYINGLSWCWNSAFSYKKGRRGPVKFEIFFALILSEWPTTKTYLDLSFYYKLHKMLSI